MLKTIGLLAALKLVGRKLKEPQLAIVELEVERMRSQDIIIAKRRSKLHKIKNVFEKSIKPSSFTLKPPVNPTPPQQFEPKVTPRIWS